MVGPAPSRGERVPERHPRARERGLDLADGEVGGLGLAVGDDTAGELRGEPLAIGVVDADDGGAARDGGAA